MKVWKKFSAVALALVMVLALGATAFADEPTAVADGNMLGTGVEDGILGEFSAVGAVANTYTNKDVILYKELKVYNKGETTVNAPTITYNYAVTAGTPSTEESPVTVKDQFGVQVGVKKGITEGVTIAGAVSQTTPEGGSTATWDYPTSNLSTTGTLPFTPSVQLTAAESGSKNTFPIKVDFSGVTFTGAGVYRYIITETVEKTGDITDEAAKNAAGIADGTISNVRYLDVYVKDSSTAGLYEIYGFVCFQNVENALNDERNAGTATNNNNVASVAKTEGFVADKGTDGTTALTADAYYTFNVTVSKTLVNDQAMKDHGFPFAVNFTNSDVTADVVIITKSTETPISGNPTNTTSALTSGALSTTNTGIADTPNIDDGSSVKYIGIPVGATDTKTTVSVYETNDVVGTTYTSDYTVDSQTVENSSKVISWSNADDANKSNTATFTVTDTTARTIAFTNTLLNISPTGVTLRYAPYLAMLGAGVVALPLTLRKKEELF